MESYFWDRMDILFDDFKSTYPTGCVSLNVSINLTLINIFQTRDDVYLCSYALILTSVPVNWTSHTCISIANNSRKSFLKDFSMHECFYHCMNQSQLKLTSYIPLFYKVI